MSHAPNPGPRQQWFDGAREIARNELAGKQ
jgi:hypothetical protein